MKSSKPARNIKRKK